MARHADFIEQGMKLADDGRDLLCQVGCIHAVRARCAVSRYSRFVAAGGYGRRRQRRVHVGKLFP